MAIVTRIGFSKLMHGGIRKMAKVYKNPGGSKSGAGKKQSGGGKKVFKNTAHGIK